MNKILSAATRDSSHRIITFFPVTNPQKKYILIGLILDPHLIWKIAFPDSVLAWNSAKFGPLLNKNFCPDIISNTLYNPTRKIQFVVEKIINRKLG